ncbi:MAG: chemotaxis-specific protein-glutamate methyltransferase CheB [Glaciecola sp.]
MKKKVLVVDDSALLRKHLKRILEGAGFEVELARDGQECLNKLPLFNPDALTLDVNMPIMDGMTCLSRIMSTKPKPVVMVSSLTEKGAVATFEALELGAVDYVPKPSMSMSESAELVIKTVSAACNTHVSGGISLKNKLRLRKEVSESVNKPQIQRTFTSQTNKIDLVLIGVSTGGPACLQAILQTIPANFPAPIVVAQHMPARFTDVFAKRLNSTSPLHVQEVVNATNLQPGHVYIAKGDADVKIAKRAAQLVVSSEPASSEYVWHPSINKLVSTATQAVNPRKLLCVQLTGMGNDGAEAMKIAHSKGATTIAESEETAVVYGMPKELVNCGGATKVLPNYKIANAIMDAVS